MARAIWSGVLTFGLVTVPVQMFTATQDHAVRFHQFERGTGDRVRNRRVNERTGKDVDYQDIVKGYDLGGGDYVVVEPEELEEIAPGRSQVIEVSGFVGLDEVEPVYFDRTYYLAPRSDEYNHVYELLRAALRGEGKIGIATFVMRAKQYLVGVRALDDLLVLHTLHWPDEVRDPQRELPRLPEHKEAGDRELRTAQQLVEALSVPWKPEEYTDTYEERLRELIEAKQHGQEVVSEKGPPEATNVVDLMDALRRSVDEAGRGRRSASPSESASSGKGRGGGRSGAAKSRSGKAGSSRKADSPAGAAKAGAGKAGSGKAGSGGKRGAGARKAGGRAELAGLSKSELYDRAAERGLSGRSKMSREELIDALAGRTGAKAAS